MASQVSKFPNNPLRYTASFEPDLGGLSRLSVQERSSVPTYPSQSSRQTTDDISSSLGREGSTFGRAGTFPPRPFQKPEADVGGKPVYNDEYVPYVIRTVRDYGDLGPSFIDEPSTDPLSEPTGSAMDRWKARR